MAGKKEKRMAGDFEIIHALHIGDKEVVLGENPAGASDEQYMCAFCEENALFANYTEVMVSGDYTELVKLFGERVAEQAEKTRIALNGPKIQGIPNAPITAEGCQRRFKIVGKRRRNFVVFRRWGCNKIKRFLAEKEYSRFVVSGA